ncbi:MAG: hypothetical protein MSS24_00925 [Clostridiales bacterium]|nr:hypothetical protein [Clostridiales bacterium]
MTSESKRQLHTRNAVVVVEFRFINDLLDSCRKNRILVRLTKILQIPVVA